MDHAEALASADDQVDQLLAPVTALLALSVLIALLGIANTLALSIPERTRELGLLRALGMARTQLRSMIRSEAAIIACLGAAMGVAVALFFGWSMGRPGVTELVFPFGQLTGWPVLATGAGMLAAILSAARPPRCRFSRPSAATADAQADGCGHTSAARARRPARHRLRRVPGAQPTSADLDLMAAVADTAALHPREVVHVL